MAVKQLGDGIVQISIERPEAINALSPEIIRTLVKDFEATCNNPATRVVIFRGAEVYEKDGVTIKYLSAFGGADLGGLVNYAKRAPISRDSASLHMQDGIQGVKKIRKLCLRGGFQETKDAPGRVVVIGWVDGPCLAGGIEIVYGVSDFVYATPNSIFGMREILLNGMGGWGGPELLRRRLLSPLWLNEMLLAAGSCNKLGDIDALTALSRGLLNEIVEGYKIVQFVLDKAKMLTTRGRMAVTANLDITDHSINKDCTDLATEHMVGLMMQPGWVKSVCAFLDRQKKK